MRTNKWLAVTGGLLLGWVGSASADAGRTGEAVVAAMTGQAQARIFMGPVHEGRTEMRDLFRGAAIGERTQIVTGARGHCCLVFTPGALMHVAPETEMTIEEVRLTAPGLPRSEDDLVRRIVIRINRGRLYINAGIPTPTMVLNVVTPAGRIEAAGGSFSLASTEGGWSLKSEEHAFDVVPNVGDRVQVPENKAAWLTSEGVEIRDAVVDERLHRFLLCRELFRSIEPFFHPTLGYDRNGLARHLGWEGPPIYLGAQGLIADVSPAFRPTAAATATPDVPTGAGESAGGRWTRERIWRWWDEVGVIRGVNYIPSTAVNSTEMWMKETFDPDTIDKELAEAKGAGFTAVRVVLQQAVWAADPDGFLDRFDKFLDLASSHGLTVVPVLFDDLNRAGREPFVGPQEAPVPGLNNARWTPCPGASAVTDMTRWPNLEEYTRRMVDRYKRDERILYWDVYNTAGNAGLWADSLPLMDAAIDWVRAENPRQPVAVPAWRDFGSPMSTHKLDRSDLITFHTFENAELVSAQLQLMQRFNRPIVVSDWLMRQRGSTFEKILPVFSTHGVGWFNRGLVRGRTQQWVQDEAFADPEQSEVWQHDVLKTDGEPYDAREIELIRGFRYSGEHGR